MCRLTTLIALAFMAVLLAIACGGDGSSPTPSPTPSPAAGAPAEVQAIVDAALSGDADALRPLLGYASIPCSTAIPMLGGPPLCREVEADGTPVDVFAVSGCHGGYVRPDELSLDALSDIDFYAVYRWPEEDFDFFAAEYAAIFSGGKGKTQGLGLMINEGKLVAVLGGCFQTPEQFVEFRQLEDVVVAPRPLSEATDVNCRLLLLAPGCAAEVTIVEPSRLNVRAYPGTDQVIIGKLAKNDIVCLLGSPAIKDNIRWWRLRTTEGTEGWAAAFDPEGPAEPWLTTAGRTCQGEQVE